MSSRRALLFLGTILVAGFGGAQTGTRPPLPPPAGAAPPGSQSGQQGVLQAPAGLPSPQVPTGSVTYEDWAKWYYRVFKIPKEGAVRVGANRVRLFRLMHAVLEVVSEDADSYYVRNLPPEDPQAVGHKAWVGNEKKEISSIAKAEYLADKYLIVGNPEVPPPFTDRVRFVPRRDGLPDGGRWQMSFDIADMNGDGLPDLVFGPNRTGSPALHVFLQQKDHSWQEANATWPTQGIKLDYGTVRVADFDGDGNKDIAIACHFSKTYVLYGDGKGNFTRFVTIPQDNPEVTSRALTVADFNNDGRPDIATFAEVDINLKTTASLHSGLVNIALNLPGGWKALAPKGFPGQLMGDQLTTADLDMNGNVDLLLTEHSANGMDLIFRNLGGGAEWKAIGSAQQPVNAYVLATAAGRLDRFKQPDVVECFEQHNPWVSEAATQACVIYRFHDANGAPTLTPTPTILFQEKSDSTTYKAVAVGDIDGDGRDDVAVATSTGQVRVFLQTSNGEFLEQKNAGMDQPGTDIFDIRIADLYHDKKGEIVFAGSPKGTVGGGIWVYAPVAPGKAGAKKAP
ncbi:MAG: VCBS repeat-containing protein [Thermoanaerobaculaceae bacterium]|jgi:hypothetical protein